MPGESIRGLSLKRSRIGKDQVRRGTLQDDGRVGIRGFYEALPGQPLRLRSYRCSTVSLVTGSKPPGSRPAVAVCCAEKLTDASAGPALRAAGLVRGLAAHGLEATLVAPEGSHAPEACSVAPLDDLARIVRTGATMVASGFLVERHPVLAESRHLVVDAASPFLLENLVVHQTKAPEQRARVLRDEAAVLARLLASADLLLCAHERQRDLTLGVMLASGALRPELIDSDPGLEQFFMTVPFGPTEAVPPIERVPRPGRLHLVWPGGLWDWLDPVCLVEAVAQARADGADVTAELWGARSPDPLVPQPRAAALVARRSRELGLDDAVEIVEWVPHLARRERLSLADVAVTIDKGGIEARFAFRTRLVDALAAGLPVIATAGEFVADEAAARGAGFTVPPRDAGALADVLRQLCAEPSRLALAGKRAPGVAAAWSYEQTLGPLADWCRSPRSARAGLSSISTASQAPGAWARRLRGLRRRAQRASNSSTRAS